MMRMTKWGMGIGALVLCFVMGGVLQTATAQKQLKKRVAVLNFEDKTEKRYTWGGGKTPGSGMADMLVTALVKSDAYTVIERAEIDRVLQEQDLGTAGIVTQQSAAEAGKMLGAEIVIFGSVTEFGYKDRSVGGATRRFGIGIESQTAVVATDVRMVNSTTGEIIAAENVRKEESKRGLKVDTRKLDFGTQSDFDESLVGEATRDAIDTIVELINGNAPNIPWEAKVVTMQGDAVFINAGSQAGVEIGDTFIVKRPGKTLVDPDTGLELGAVEEDVGVIKVADNTMGNGKAARCTVVSGGNFQRGDLVREQQ
jgi:curli biogenesis system outer membrane secretion channel CsgG